MKKKELQALLTDIERVLNQTSTNANNAAKEYSPELVAQLAFEVGYLGGGIKTVLEMIKEKSSK